MRCVLMELHVITMYDSRFSVSSFSYNTLDELVTVTSEQNLQFLYYRCSKVEDMGLSQ